MKKVINVFKKMQQPDARAFWVSIVISVLAPVLGDIIAPLYFARYTDLMVHTSPSNVVYHFALIYAFLLFTKVFIWRIGNFLLAVVEYKTLDRVGNLTAHHLLSLSVDFFKDNATGALVGKHNKFARAYERMYDEAFFNLIPSIVIFMCVMPVLCVRMPLIGVGMIGIGIVFVFITYQFSRWIQPFNDKLSNSDSKVTAVFSDQLSNINTIHAFGTVEQEKELFSLHNKNRTEKRKNAWLKGYVQWSTNDLFQIVMTVASILITLHFWSTKVFSVGDVILVMSYTTTLSQRLSNMGNIIKNMKQLQADADEMIKILDKKPSVQDNGILTPTSLAGDIVFDNVTFSYPDTSIQTFSQFNLHIKQGEKVGLVGQSGSGKSTLVKLLMREMDIQEGKLSIDGLDIKELKLCSLRSNIALVPQEPSLFHRSIKDNISYARPTASFEEVIEAAKKAQAHDFIMKTSSKHDSGYETKVGEKGVKLSGGQRQRVAIARAFLANRPILIFDEATSSLDSISEMKIQQAMDELLKGNETMICIAHRLSTVAKMDRIIVLDNGSIVEQGSHTTLIANNGTYAEMWHKQLAFDES